MSVELVHVYRGERIESIHRGDVAIVDSGGKLIAHYGDPQKRTFWRSAAKPFQVLPFVESAGIERFGIDGEELALMCASHGGEPKHVAKVRGLLDKIGLDEAALDCGASRPMFEGAYRQLLRSGEPFLAVHNPCSGKHSAMLAYLQLVGWDRENYIQPDHPLQKLILETIAQVSGMDQKEIDVAVDGCGVPVFGLPIMNMARAYSELARPSSRPALSQIADAMTRHPYYVSGTHRLDMILMEETQGRLVAKLGAESVYCVGLVNDGKALTLKIEDGGYRALNPLVPVLLERYGFITADERKAIEARLRLSITNHRKETIGHYEVLVD